MLLPTALRKSWIYQLLSFIVSRDASPIGNKVPNWNLYWSANNKFYSRLGIWNCKSVWFADKFISFCAKNESSLKRTVSLKDFLQAIRNPVRKRTVYKTKVMITNSAIKCNHESHLISQKNLFRKIRT